MPPRYVHGFGLSWGAPDHRWLAVELIIWPVFALNLALDTLAHDSTRHEAIEVKGAACMTITELGSEKEETSASASSKGSWD
jgi:hypothetical protein